MPYENGSASGCYRFLYFFKNFLKFQIHFRITYNLCIVNNAKQQLILTKKTSIL